MLEAAIPRIQAVTPCAVPDQVEQWREFGQSVPRRRRWLLLRQPTSRYLGAGRNVAARAATGEFLFFLDDDNCIKRHALATLVRASRATGAHVLTSLNEKWPSRQRPPESDDATERWLPLGAAATVGMLTSCVVCTAWARHRHAMGVARARHLHYTCTTLALHLQVVFTHY